MDQLFHSYKNHAAEHERDESGHQQPVHRPPPFAQGCALLAGDHGPSAILVPVSFRIRSSLRKLRLNEANFGFGTRAWELLRRLGVIMVAVRGPFPAMIEANDVRS